MNLLTRLRSALRAMANGAKKIDLHDTASLAQRWCRPIFFVLMTVILIIGWFHPETLGVYFDVLTRAPDWLTEIFTILILGLAVEKTVARPLHNAYVASRGVEPLDDSGRYRRHYRDPYEGLDDHDEIEPPS